MTCRGAREGGGEEGPGSEPSVRRIAGRVCDVERPARSLTIIRLALSEGASFPFRAGQYAYVAFDGRAPRAYSMANRPDRGPLEFHVRGRGASGFFERLRPGEKAVLEGPFGRGFLREDRSARILAIAGGSGIAPVKSIVETALGLGLAQPIHVYFGAKTVDDLYLEDHFRELCRGHPNLRFTSVLSAPDGATGRRTGLVADVAACDFADLSGWRAYVYGPPPMVHAAARLLRRRGLAADWIHSDELDAARA